MDTLKAGSFQRIHSEVFHEAMELDRQAQNITGGWQDWPIGRQVPVLSLFSFPIS
jgi:hypothetical protein